MADVAKLRELLERCEKASGPNDDLDVDLCVTLQWTGYPGDGIRNIRRSDDQGWIDYEDAEGECTDMVPELTASLDASIALVERMLPGWMMAVGTFGPDGEPWATITRPNEDFKDYSGHASSMPLAILSALLSALLSKAELEMRDLASDVWPAGCIKPNSCGRNMQCMYAPSGEQCRHFDRDISAEVQSVMAARPNTQTEQERP